MTAPGVDAVIFDLDGVLMDSEQRWNAAKEELVRESGGRWRDEAPTVMMGVSSLLQSGSSSPACRMSSATSRLNGSSFS